MTNKQFLVNVLSTISLGAFSSLSIGFFDPAWGMNNESENLTPSPGKRLRNNENNEQGGAPPPKQRKITENLETENLDLKLPQVLDTIKQDLVSLKITFYNVSGLQNDENEISCCQRLSPFLQNAQPSLEKIVGNIKTQEDKLFQNCLEEAKKIGKSIKRKEKPLHPSVVIKNFATDIEKALTDIKSCLEDMGKKVMTSLGGLTIAQQYMTVSSLLTLGEKSHHMVTSLMNEIQRLERLHSTFINDMLKDLEDGGFIEVIDDKTSNPPSTTPPSSDPMIVDGEEEDNVNTSSQKTPPPEKESYNPQFLSLGETPSVLPPNTPILLEETSLHYPNTEEVNLSNYFRPWEEKEPETSAPEKVSEEEVTKYANLIIDTSPSMQVVIENALPTCKSMLIQNTTVSDDFLKERLLCMLIGAQIDPNHVPFIQQRSRILESVGAHLVQEIGLFKENSIEAWYEFSLKRQEKLSWNLFQLHLKTLIQSSEFTVISSLPIPLAFDEETKRWSSFKALPQENSIPFRDPFLTQEEEVRNNTLMEIPSENRENPTLPPSIDTQEKTLLNACIPRIPSIKKFMENCSDSEIEGLGKCFARSTFYAVFLYTQMDENFDSVGSSYILKEYTKGVKTRYNIQTQPLHLLQAFKRLRGAPKRWNAAIRFILQKIEALEQENILERGVLDKTHLQLQKIFP